MARYYESKTLIEFVKKYTPHINGETTMECVERAIREAPTADVVPKSEVDLYRKQVVELEDELAKTYDKLETAKADVAKIFAEIEREIKNHGITYAQRKIAELKKKYTEEKT